MRVLHARHDHGRRKLPPGEPRPHRGGGPRVARGQPLPMHRLSEHRRLDPRCRTERRVIPAPFEYARVGSVDEAVEALAADTDAKLLAGGHSLLPAMRLRMARPSTLVDIGRLED